MYVSSIWIFLFDTDQAHTVFAVQNNTPSSTSAPPLHQLPSADTHTHTQSHIVIIWGSFSDISPPPPSRHGYKSVFLEWSPNISVDGSVCVSAEGSWRTGGKVLYVGVGLLLCICKSVHCN
jgi:hypothetical protein